MHDIISWFINKAHNSLSQLKEEVKTIRAGKVNPSLLENIIVEAYQGQMKLKLNELAAITNYDNSTLIVKPYDPSIIHDIEKSLLKSPLGISPRLENNQFKILFPPLSQEQRAKYLKLLNQIIEDGKNLIRRYRDEARKKIKMSFEAKEISEDQKFRFEKLIDEETKKVINEIDVVKNSKEEEILNV